MDSDGNVGGSGAMQLEDETFVEAESSNRPLAEEAIPSEQ